MYGLFYLISMYELIWLNSTGMIIYYICCTNDAILLYVGMAPADSGAGAAKTRPQRNPRGQEKPAHDKSAGGILHPHPHPPGFGRVSGARGFGKIYYKNRQLHNLNRQTTDFS